MGIFMNAFKQALKNQRKAAQQQARLAERVQREKEELANKIREQAKEQSQQLIKVVKDCVELVNTTTNPDVFFKRYNLMLEHLESLAGLECTGVFANSPELPSVAFLRIEAQFDAATIGFLDRSFENAKSHANTLKTENGKKNAIKRYFDNMEKYIIYMDSEGLEYFDNMKKGFL